MLLKVNGYEISITARGKINENEFNSEDTKYFLNDLVGWIIDANFYQRGQGFNAVADHSVNAATEIYHFLKERGFYNV